MRAVKLIGIMLVVLILGGIIPYNLINAEVVQDKKLEAYKEILDRALNLSYLTPDLRNRIKEIINSKPANTQDVQNLIAEAKNILKDIENLVEERSEVGWKIEERKLSSLITILVGFAREMNATDVENLLSKAQAHVNKGDVKEARMILDEALKKINEIRAEASSEAVEKSTISTFEYISSNKTALEGVVKAISNINMTIVVLENLKVRLINVNASQEAINSLERVITTLNSTVGILENIVEVVETAGVEERVGNVTERIATNRVLEEVCELRIDIHGLLNETMYLEQKLNISLGDIQNNLTESLVLLNQSENLVSKGNVGEAIGILSRVKARVKSIEKILDRYEETLEESLGEEGKLEEYVAEKLVDVKEAFQEMLNRSRELCRYASSINSSYTLSILEEANETLNELSNIINETESVIANGDFDEALNLLNTAEEKLDYVDELLDKAKNMLQVVSETIEEMCGKISGLRESLMELENETNESLSGVVLDKALGVIEGLMDQLNEAEYMARNGSIHRAGEILKEVGRQISRLEECIGDMAGLFDEMVGLKENITELRKEYANNTIVLGMLDEAEEFLNQTEAILVDTLENINPELLNEAESLIENVKNIIESILEEYQVGEYHIGFKIVDTFGKPVSNASIIFNDEEYHSGDSTYINEGVYELRVDNIPEGYSFDHWIAIGGVTIDNNTAVSTEAVVNGSGKIVLVLRKMETREFTISIYIKDVYGNIIPNATIIINGTEYSSGEQVKLPTGEYSLSIGTIPKGYKFGFWSQYGGVFIDDPSSMDTEVMVRGEGVIILILVMVGG